MVWAGGSQLEQNTHFNFNDGGEIMYKQGSSHTAGYYNLTCQYYVHGTCPTFHRLIVSIEGLLFVFKIKLLHGYAYM